MRFLKNKGFTLLELLVVISIIGILVAMGAVAYSTAQKKGRNAKRIGDMKAMQAAFEQYYASAGAYHDSEATMVGAVGLTLPVEIKPNHNAYYYDTQPTLYLVCAYLECDLGSNCSQGNFQEGVGFTNTGTNRSVFCAKNLQ